MLRSLPIRSPRLDPIAASLAIIVICAAGLSVTPLDAQTLVALTRAAPSPGAPVAPATVLVTNQQLLTAPTLLATGGGLIGLARNPTNGDVFTLGEGKSLLRVDLVKSSVSLVGILPAAITSLAFDSHGNLFGFAYCDTTFPNQLFQLDPATGNGTGVLPSLDAASLAPCGGDGPYLAMIAIDPADDVLFMTSVDAAGTLFIDRFDAFFVPTKVFSDLAITNVPIVYPFAATFAGGRMWLSFGTVQSLLNGTDGAIAAFDPVAATLSGGGASFTAIGFPNSVVALGLLESESTCAPSATATCLNNRFRVQASYDATPANGKGPATVLLESAQSVKFSFFDPTNIELIVKVLDACAPPFNRWWVAAGGLTNVGVTIKVTDTKTGKVKTYTNPKNSLFQAFFDTDAFPCP